MKSPLTLAIAVWLTVTTAHAQTAPYRVSGNINGLQNSYVYLQYLPEGESTERVDSVKCTNGQFEFSPAITEPTLAYLIIKAPEFSYPFFTDAGITRLSGNMQQPETIKATGGPVTTSFYRYNQSLEIIKGQQRALAMQIYTAEPKLDSAAEAAVWAKYAALRQQENQATLAMIDTNRHNPVSPCLLEFNFSYGEQLKIADSLVQLFTDDAAKSRYTKSIKLLVEGHKNTQPGKPAPPINLPNSKNQPVILSDYRGKLLLIDFWASWCAPCRKEHPDLVELYKTYNPKGFEILSVSFDVDPTDWQNAVTADKLSWANVICDGNFNSPTAHNYAIRGVPTRFLINSEGVIIAANIRGEALKEKLKELLGE